MSALTGSPRILDWVAALPDLGMAVYFAAVWVAPERFGDGALSYLLLVMLLEFIVIHSAAFMGSVAFGDPQVRGWLRWGKGVGVLGLGLFYSLFILGFCLSFHTWWPMLAFWVLTLNRLLGAIIGQGETTAATQRLISTGWAVGAMAYLGSTFLTLFIPLPRFGISDAVVTAAHLPGGGAWIDQPWRAVAMGVIYFAVVGWYELRWRAWGKPEAGITPT